MIAKRYEPFWKTTSLKDMSSEEWESICDGCGKCCLQKLLDDDTEEVFYTDLACHQLDIAKCQCKVYPTREQHVESCLTLTVDDIPEFHWLPDTCSYRVLSETGELPTWHPLVVGNDKEMQKQGLKVTHYAIDESKVDEEDWDTHIIKWVHGMPESYDPFV